jgi:hypothetical protein
MIATRRQASQIAGRPCCYCKRPMTRREKYEYGMRSTDFTRDHIVPLGRGGKNELANRAWACSGCNQAKGDMMPDEWAAWMAAHPDWVPPPTALDRRLDLERQERERLKCAGAVEQPGVEEPARRQGVGYRLVSLW